MVRYRSRKPYYNDDSDYTTNAPSYYDDLARKNKLIKELAERIGFYDEELAKRFEEWDKLIEDLPDELKRMLIEWFDDGKLAELLAQLMLEDYATIKWVNEEITNFFNQINDNLEENYATKKIVNELNESITNTIDEFKENVNNRLDNSDVVYTVGVNGDFDTLNNAIDHIRDRSIKPKKVTVTLLDDYVLRDQVIFINEDMRYVEIVSNGVTSVSINNDSVEMFDNVIPVFYGDGSNLPVINVLFNYVGIKSGNLKSLIGMYLSNSSVLIREDKGFTNFSYIGVSGVNNSNIVANGGVFNNNGILANQYGAGIKVSRSSLNAQNSLANKCGEYGYWIQQGSVVNVTGSTATECGHHNLVISQGSTGTARNSTFTDCQDNAVVVTTNSSLDLSGSDCSRCGNNNIVVQLNSSLYFENGISNDSGISGLNVTKHSYASAQGATLNNNDRHGLDSKDGSDVNFLQGIATGNGANGIYCLDGSKVACRSSTLNNNGEQGIHCYGGYVDAYRATIKNNTISGIRSFNGGRVTADESDIQNNGVYGLHASRGEIWANRGICKNNKGDWDISASWGGEITCSEVEVSSSGERIRCTSSSIIKANSVKGSAKANKPRNAINDQGVIYSNNIVSDLD